MNARPAVSNGGACFDSRAATRGAAPSPLVRVTRAGVCSLLAIALVVPAGTQAQEAARAADAPASTPTTAAAAETTAATAAQVPTPPDGLPAWTLATLPDEPVTFHGIVNTDNAGLGSGTMLYPTAGLGVLGLLVGVATHAVLVAGSRSSQEAKMQASADKVLEPYRGVLAGFRQRDLVQRALVLTPSAAVAHQHDAKDTPPGELFVQAAPVFMMTSDAAALVLDETVVVRPGPASDKGTPQVIRVVSPPRTEEDLRAAWTADDGAALKLASSSMLAQSLDLALQQTRHPADDKLPFRTLRYALGDVEKMERGQLLAETCDHMVIRTLRGGLMVVPHRAGAVLPDGCPAAPAVPVRKAPAEAAAASATTAANVAAPAASAASGAAS